MHRFFFPLLAIAPVRLAMFGASFEGARLLGCIGLAVVLVSFVVCEFCAQADEDECEVSQ